MPDDDSAMPRVPISRRRALKGILTASATASLASLESWAANPQAKAISKSNRQSVSDDDWLRTKRHRLAYDFHFADNKADFFNHLDPEGTAQTLADAGVHMLQLCAKSLWGYTVYPTKVGRIHPNLHGRDYFKDIVDALNKRGIKCMAYFADNTDNLAAKEHPEWRFLNLKQSRGEEPYFPDEWWKPICPETGYSDYLIAQIKEVATAYPVAGIFIDGVGFPGYCYCTSCRRQFREDTRLDIPEKEDWSRPEWRAFIHWRYDRFDHMMEKRRAAVKDINEKLIFSYNYGGGAYHYYAAGHEPMRGSKHADYLTTETLPWDFLYGLQGTSQTAKYVRAASGGKPIEIVGARTSGAHDYTEKPLPEMMLEAYSALAHNCPHCLIESSDANGQPTPAVSN
jgi:hypothetical protein